MMKRSILIILSLLLCFNMFAQERVSFTLTGVVNDELGEPMSEAALYLKDRVGIGTVSDADGKFSIKVNVGDILVASFVGYQKKEFMIIKEETEPISIQLFLESNLEEVVVMGIGAKRKITSVGSVTTVDVKELQVPATSIANLLGGKVAGIISMQSSGEPGKNIAEFWIRGIGTFGYNSGALVLIDGLEGDLNSVDPADLESLSVLKDASATAVYGVRGANGVVIITTKRGVAGKLNITGRAYTSLSVLRRLPEYLRAPEYAALANEARAVRGDDRIYSDIELGIIKNGLDPDMYPDVDWQSELIKRVSLAQKYFVSAQGGGDIARYYLSLAGSNEEGAYNVDRNSIYSSNVGYNTYAFKTNLDLSLTKTTDIYFGASGFLATRKSPGIDNTDWLWWAQSQINPLMFPLRYSTGQLPGAAGKMELISPYVLINHTGRGNTQNYKGMATIQIKQDLAIITEGLKWSAQGAYNINSDFTEQRRIMPSLYRALGRNSAGNLVMQETRQSSTAEYGKNVDQYRKFYFKSTANWQRSFDEHRLSALINYEISDEKQASEGSTNLNSIPKRYQGVASWLTYSFQDTYMIDVNFGYTGSENFQPGRQYGLFPSIGVGWAPSNYQWFKDKIPLLNYLKIKATYGETGNDRISDRRFPYLTLLSTGGSGIFGGGGVSTVNETFTGADNLAWEKETKANLGIEGRMIKDKLTFTIEFYQNKRDGIFQPRRQVPEYVGLINSPYGNVGAMKSYGSDGNLGFSHEINKDMSFTIRGNYTYSKNLVKNWEDIYQKYPYQERNGYPNSVVRGFQAIGFFKDEDDVLYSPTQTWNVVMPGDLKYKDVNGDGKITDDDQVPLAYSNFPLLMYGFGGDFHYKNLTVGIMFKGRGETPFFRVQNGGWGWMPFRDGEDGNVLSIVNDPHNRWIPMDYALAHGIDPALAENPNAQFPRLQYGDNANNRQMSDFWKSDGRFLRLQEVNIEYNLKHNYLKKAGIKSLTFSLVGNNLYIWDKVKLFDPEQAGDNGRAYPIPMTISFQIYINI
ncbi:MAG: TonB-dependent receptor [Prevotellaceae bacterium]|nr:TonB-dependent receptor [Prevotellaceae bacterium]